MTRYQRRHLLAPLEERLLALLLLQPEREWYRSELARTLELRPSSLQRPLLRLVETDVLATRRSGNRLYYRANTASPLHGELRSLIAKTSGLVGVLRETLSGLAGGITVAFVYGSMATGEEVSTSDIDLFIVGDVTLLDLAPLLRPAEERLGREVNPMTYSPSQLRKRVRAGNHFVRSVLAEPKLFVVGTEDDLRGACGPKAGGRATSR